MKNNKLNFRMIFYGKILYCFNDNYVIFVKNYFVVGLVNSW